MNTIIEWVEPTACVRLMTTLGHFLWQGVAIALIAHGIARSMRSAQLRYVTFGCGLMLMAASPVATFVWLGEAPMPIASEAVGDADVLAPTVAGWEAMPELPPSSPMEAAEAEPPLAALPASLSLTEPLLWQRLALWATGVYAIAVCVLLARLAIGLDAGRRLASEARAVDADLLERIARLAQSVGLRCVPPLAYSSRVAVPTVVGFLKPTVLLPIGLLSGLSPDQVEAILIHELSHIRRYDHVINVLQRVVEAFLFFHPAVWWISRSMRIEREHCCDDVVVRLGSRPLDYAQSLLLVAERGMSHGMPARGVVGLFAVARPSRLRGRIARLLGEPVELQVRLPRVWACSLPLVLAALLAAPFMVAPSRSAGPSEPANGLQVPPTPQGETDFPPFEHANQVDTFAEPTRAPVIVGESSGETERGTNAQSPGRLFASAVLRSPSDAPRVLHAAIAIDPNSGQWAPLGSLSEPEGSVRFPLATIRVSRDGRQMLFQKGEAVWRGSATGDAVPERVFDKGLPAAWSPDGSEFIAAVPSSQDPRNVENFRVSADGKRSEKLPIEPNDWVQDWSRDGRWLVVQNRKDGRLYVTQVDGRERRALTSPGDSTQDDRARFAPNSKRLVYVRSRFGDSVVFSLRSVNFDGSDDRELLGERPAMKVTDRVSESVRPGDELAKLASRAPMGAAWSPDGKSLAVVTCKVGPGGEIAGLGGEWQLAIMSADGGELREIKLHEASLMTLAMDAPEWCLPTTQPENQAAEQAEPSQNRQTPWVAVGRVTDSDGKPMADVEIRAHAGIGSLKMTGMAKSDAEGRYELRFGPGVAFSRDNRAQLQAATISVHKPGWFERNLHRQGDLLGAFTLDGVEFPAWGKKDAAAVFLPNQPKEIDFVMLPAARATGKLIDSQGRPLVNYRMSLTGKDLPPSSGALASGGRTDEQGRFEFRDIPTGYAYQILVEPPKAESPWLAWATGPIEFRDPGPRSLVGMLRSEDSKVELVADQFEIELKGDGVNWKKALAQKVSKDEANAEPEGDTVRVRGATIRMALDPNDDEIRASGVLKNE